MKKLILVIAVALTSIMSASAQESMHDKAEHSMKKHVDIISLDQTPGEFTVKQLELVPGTYKFEINNKGVGHDVGFVLVPKGKDINNPENHIKGAYVTAPVANNSSQSSKTVTLTEGEYVYFCPLNPTATDNTIVVKK
ncbi:hypothetical protein [Nonlabens ponticola]|uniref:Blue (type 1) copper domain-containing protein n=1 Tax=Nonlabens ponticola TaxID=2496866 RepID=A0A3S9N073_9FLAO|nr:hypothetical protein [Nonlabens ponticola]AZQ44946.1 hypothetical protein EJ995_12185 [Nonlabens ponticola]